MRTQIKSLEDDVKHLRSPSPLPWIDSIVLGASRTSDPVQRLSQLGRIGVFVTDIEKDVFRKHNWNKLSKGLERDGFDWNLYQEEMANVQVDVLQLPIEVLLKTIEGSPYMPSRVVEAARDGCAKIDKDTCDFTPKDEAILKRFIRVRLNDCSDHASQVDPQELSWDNQAAFQDAEKFVDATTRGDYDGIGSVHNRWNLKKEYLKNKHGIDWKTPAEMNPGTMFD